MTTPLPAPRAMPDARDVNAFEASPVLDRVLRRWLDPAAYAFAHSACTELGELVFT